MRGLVVVKDLQIVCGKWGCTVSYAAGVLAKISRDGSRGVASYSEYCMVKEICAVRGFSVRYDNGMAVLKEGLGL